MVTVVNSKADVLKATQALGVNCSAAKDLQEIMKTNLGPRGTLKMLVGGAGQIKITKDGEECCRTDVVELMQYYG
jgi:T-complex protein 1 subunit zeta